MQSVRENLVEIGKKTTAFKPESYLRVYEKMFEPLRHLELSLLELGIWDGGSLDAWATYFPYGRIAGVDLKLPELPPHDRIHMFEGDQADPAVLSRAAAAVAPNGFDIIIDDCAHIGTVAKASFWYLFEHHLKPGAIYVIEDWGTGYMSDWPDGKVYAPEPDGNGRMPSHDAGMVGFIKQLLDEVYPGNSFMVEPRDSKFESISIHWGLCIITKALGSTGHTHLINTRSV